MQHFMNVFSMDEIISGIYIIIFAFAIAANTPKIELFLFLWPWLNIILIFVVAIFHLNIKTTKAKRKSNIIIGLFLYLPPLLLMLGIIEIGTFDCLIIVFLALSIFDIFKIWFYKLVN